MSASDTALSRERKRKRSFQGAIQSLSSNVQPAIEISGNASVHMGDQYFLGRDAEQEAIDTLAKSLLFPEILRRYENIREQHNGTYEWILSTSEQIYWDNEDRSDLPWNFRDTPPWDPFIGWLQGDQPIYWISGKPGSGKSTLMKYLLDHLQTSDDQSQHPQLSLSFWFWEAGQELERNLEGCVRSLLWQCLQSPPTRRLVCDKLHQHHQGFAWTRSRLLKCLKSCLSTFEHANISVRIFLDGLDESGADANDTLQLFTNLSQQLNTVKVCISSRPEQFFVNELSRYPKLRLQDLNARDISKVIREDFLQNAKVARLLAGDNNLAEVLKRRLIDKAQGVFLWVNIAIRSLVRGLEYRDSFKILEARLEQLPDDLDNLYSRMLGRTEVDMKIYKEYAAFCFRLLLSTSALSILQLSLANNESLRRRMLDPPFDFWDDEHLDKTIISEAEEVSSWVTIRTGGLLEINKDKYTYPRGGSLGCLDRFASLCVDFIHRTARTYLLESTNGQEILSMCKLTEQDTKCICFEILLIEEYILRGLNQEFPNMAYRPNTGNKSLFCCEPYSSTGADMAISIWTELSRRSLLYSTSTIPSTVSAMTANLFFPCDEEGMIDACRVCCLFGWFRDAQRILLRSTQRHKDVAYLSTLLLFAFSIMEYTPAEGRIAFIRTILDMGGDPLYEFYSQYEEKISVLPLILVSNSTDDIGLLISRSNVEQAQWRTTSFVPSFRDIDYQGSAGYSLKGKNRSRYVLDLILNISDIMKFKSMPNTSRIDAEPSKILIVRYMEARYRASHRAHAFAVTEEDSKTLLLMLDEIMTELRAANVEFIPFSLEKNRLVIYPEFPQTWFDASRCWPRLLDFLNKMIKRAQPIRTLLEASLCFGKTEEAVRRYVADEEAMRRKANQSEYEIMAWKAWALGPS